MASIAKVKFHVAVAPQALRVLDAHCKAEQARENGWIAAQRQELLTPGMPRRTAATVRREIRAEVARLRRSGEFGGTRDDIVTRAVREELRARGLDQTWPVPPEAALNGPGRPWGTALIAPLGEGGYTDRVTVNLPLALGEMVRRAAYWTSKVPVEALQTWADLWGDGADVTLREADRAGVAAELALLAAAGRPSAPRTALEIRDRLRAQVLTTGDLLRASIDRAAGPRQPEIPDESGD